jgi:hypothetical protein
MILAAQSELTGLLDLASCKFEAFRSPAGCRASIAAAWFP